MIKRTYNRKKAEKAYFDFYLNETRLFLLMLTAKI